MNYLVLENEYIPLADGRRLAARIWLPDTVSEAPAPAILEYLPYRKRDGTAERDESTYPVLAEAGYAGVRVDMAGHGESDGEFDDEYSPRELDDGLAVIAWIAGQAWCDGNVGMMGISWGGFNGLQLAALRPPALKAVISIGTTVDRYNDDIHYKNGCHLYSNFWWSSVMLGYASRPPDPELSGPEWRDRWLHRLTTQPFPLSKWLAHQRRDAYWKHGSICEHYEKITIPCLVVSGWADGYLNAPPAAVENIGTHTKAINGPWIHKYPYLAYPHPRLDFHQEAIRWWDRWLRGMENNVAGLPDYRAYILENIRPSGWREYDPGRWVAEQNWPSKNILPTDYYLDNHRLTPDLPGQDRPLSICSPQDCGLESGEFFPLKPDREMPGNQCEDDAGSLVFDTPPLDADLEILGRPVLKLKVAIDRPVGNLIARLVDVHPDHVGYRVSWGVLNLCHRNSHEHPEFMIPGEWVEIALQLDECGYRFVAGHRIRVALSTAYWPTVLPSPEIVTATFATGGSAALTLPVRTGGEEGDLPVPDHPDPLPGYEITMPARYVTGFRSLARLRYEITMPARYERRVTRNRKNNTTTMRILDDTGEQVIPGHALRVRQKHVNRWQVNLRDPSDTCLQATFSCWMTRGHWRIKTVSRSELVLDPTRFHIRAEIKAYEGAAMIHARTWKQSIPRDFM